MRRNFELLIGVALLGASAALPTAVQAQSFDGTWTGRDGCPAYGDMRAWTEARTATIVRDHFRFERNSSTLYELTEGTVQPDGTTGQGQRRDWPVRWTAQLSGGASAATITLTGTRSAGRPCSMELSNTQPAPYSLAGQEIGRQQQVAEAEAEKRTEAERQRNANATAEAAPARAQRERTAKERVAEAQLQQLRSDAEAAKQKASELEKELAAVRAAQQANDKQAERQKAEEAELQQLRVEAEAAKQSAANAETLVVDIRTSQEKDRAISQTQIQKNEKEVTAINLFLKNMILPDSENLEDWISEKAAIPIQEQQFCLVIKDSDLY